MWHAILLTLGAAAPAEESWWSHNSGSLFIAVAAVLAAGLAAFVAMRNQGKQLAHDRHLRNLDHIRDTIDAAVVAANETEKAIDRFTAAVQTVEERRDREEEVDSRGLIAPERDKALSSIQSMRAALVRLEMRLGKNDQVSTAYSAAAKAFSAVFRNGLGAGSTNREQTIRDGDAEREKAASEAFSAFQSACFDWLNK